MNYPRNTRLGRDDDSYDAECSLLARIAWMYYVQGLTQQEIGQRLHYSRTKITRLLAKAREREVVRITINSKFRSCFDTEVIMKKRFGLKKVILVPTGDTVEETRDGVGKACASFLEETLIDGDILGCSWGWNLYNVGKSLRSLKYKQLSVVQLLGGLNISEKINPQRILELIASKLSATGVWLNTPAIVDSPEIKKALLNDEGVRRALEQGRSCTKALIGIGDVTNEASLIASKALTLKDIKELKALGAVGDIMSWFFDISGSLIQCSIKERLIAISLDDMKKIPLRIGCTSGLIKAKSILGALRGEYINALVTDENAAHEVLRLCDSHNSHN